MIILIKEGDQMVCEEIPKKVTNNSIIMLDIETAVEELEKIHGHMFIINTTHYDDIDKKLDIIINKIEQ